MYQLYIIANKLLLPDLVLLCFRNISAKFDSICDVLMFLSTVGSSQIIMQNVSFIMYR